MIRQYKIHIYSILLSAMIMGGCKKEFINNVTPTNAASEDQVYSTAGTVRSYFNGIYRSMRTQWTSIDASVGGTTDTWGYNSINLTRDVKGKDVVMPYNSFYYFDYQ